MPHRTGAPVGEAPTEASRRGVRRHRSRTVLPLKAGRSYISGPRQLIYQRLGRCQESALDGRLRAPGGGRRCQADRRDEAIRSAGAALARHQRALDAAFRLRAPSRSPSLRCSRISTGSSSARGNGLRDRGAAGACPRCPPATRSGAMGARMCADHGRTRTAAIGRGWPTPAPGAATRWIGASFMPSADAALDDAAQPPPPTPRSRSSAGFRARARPSRGSATTGRPGHRRRAGVA